MSQRVPIRVPESKLSDWDSHVEEHTSEGTETVKYDSRSQFIKYAVDQQIKRDEGTAETSNRESGGSEGGETVDRLVQTVDRMAGQIESLEDRVEDATRSMQAGGSVDEATTTEVWAALPTAVERATTAEGIAEGLDVSPNTVRVALESLHSDTGSVVQKREIQQVDEGDEKITVTDQQGREIEIEGASTAIRRRNPLWWRVE